MSTFLSTRRHDDVFSCMDFIEKGEPIHIIGVGATGSKIAISLAKLGLGEQLVLWDDDVVESHNVANQAYGLNHVGTPKVEACSSIIQGLVGVSPVIRKQKVTARTRLSGYVFLLVDSMDTRQEIWSGALKMKLPIKCVLETRMGTDQGRVYVFDPKDSESIANWEDTLYTSAESTASACGSKISVGPTADAVSAFAVWQFIRWFNNKAKGTPLPEFETIFGLNPIGIFTTAMA